VAVHMCVGGRMWQYICELVVECGIHMCIGGRMWQYICALVVECGSTYVCWWQNAFSCVPVHES